MRRLATAREFALVTFLLLLAGHPAKAQQKAEWTWLDRSGKTHPHSELERILRKHLEWLDSHGKSGNQAVLGGTNLNRAKLNDANLDSADLSDADLSDAGLHGAYLRHASLDDANLSNASLGRAILSDAKLNY